MFEDKCALMSGDTNAWQTHKLQIEQICTSVIPDAKDTFYPHLEWCVKATTEVLVQVTFSNFKRQQIVTNYD